MKYYLDTMNMKKELKGSVKVFFIDYDAINTSNILDNSYSIA